MLKDETSDTLILHLPIHSKEIEEPLLNDNLMEYDPNINIPEPYEPDINKQNYSKLDLIDCSDKNKLQNIDLLKEFIPSDCLLTMKNGMSKIETERGYFIK